MKLLPDGFEDIGPNPDTIPYGPKTIASIVTTEWPFGRFSLGGSHWDAFGMAFWPTLIGSIVAGMMM